MRLFRIIVRELDQRRGLGIAICLFAACVLPVAPSRGQPSSPVLPDAAARTPAYEIISVKPSKPGCNVMSFHSPPGRLAIRCYQLRRLLFVAYGIRLDAKIPGMPGWGDSAAFDIDAKADEATTDALNRLDERDQLVQTLRMIQALLADRFRLRVHTETRQEPVYDLVIARNGFKLKPTEQGDGPDGYYSWGRGHIQVRGGPIASLVYCLSEGLTDRAVIDKTGLSGNYDIDLKWTPDDEQGTPDAGPTLFTALEEQLGLKVIPSRGPVETFVVDHAAKPTEN